MNTKYIFFNRVYHLMIGWGLVAAIAGCQHKSGSHFSESAQDALSTMEVAEGFQIELIAAEPLVADPVAMEIDEYGRLYVVEMHGYPLDKGGSGKVRLLTDTNGDGQMDNSTIFAENLMLPTGIMRWKDGVIVTDAPDVLYLEDSDGDGRADIKKTILTGFALSNPQHNVNTPLLGMDNWIYLAHEPAVSTQAFKEEFGDRGSEIVFTDMPDGPRLPVNANGRNVRFRLDTHELEMLAGKTQFGQTFDAWGHLFLNNNSNHIFQELIAARYVQRNPDLLVTNVNQSLSDHGNAAEVFPITKNPEHQLLTDVGVITAAGGITAYLGGAFPEEYENSTFVTESVHNLVHVDRLKDKGTNFTASRILPDKEFLASTDAWSRPVNLYVGPDGALYVLDYYRQIIEHPEWMAEDVIKSGALYNGTDQGRIYRITTEGTKPLTWSKELKLGDATNEELVEYLAHANAWWRRNAQRLLIDRDNAEIIPALSQMAGNKNPFGRLHALWTLEGMGQLSPKLIQDALKDPVAGVRENAIKLAELHLAEPGMAEALLALEKDSDPKVRYQLLCTLGFLDTPEATTVRQNLLFRDIEDEWVQIAALSAASSQHDVLLDAVLASFKDDVPAYTSLVQRLSAMTGRSGDLEKVHQLFRKATTSGSESAAKWQASVLEGLAQGLRRSGSADLQKEKSLLVQTYFDHSSAEVRKASLDVLKVIGLPENASTKAAVEKSLSRAKNKTLPAERRAEALDFLALNDPVKYKSLFKELIAPGEQLPVQLSALQAFSSIPGVEVSEYVLEQWTVLTPDLRDAALNTFLTDQDRKVMLLDAIEKGDVRQSSLGWRRSVRLMTQGDEALKSRARLLLATDEAQQREIVKQYEPAIELAADYARGEKVFQSNCAVCHLMGGENGYEFGPDLAMLKSRQPQSIMADILAPDISIADGYDLWAVELKSGEVLQGVISAETSTALTLVNAGGYEKTISRQDIQSLKALGMSAMPAGLEKQIDQQSMADLLTYIKQFK